MTQSHTAEQSDELDFPWTRLGRIDPPASLVPRLCLGMPSAMLRIGQRRLGISRGLWPGKPLLARPLAV